MNNKRCTLQPLASSEICDLWVCTGCKKIHLNMGDFSLRLSWEAAVGLSETFSMAVQQQENIFEFEQRNALQKRVIN